MDDTDPGRDGNTIDIDAFEASLAIDGFSATPKEMAPGEIVAAHSHPFAVRALVTRGDITLTVGSAARTYRAGDVFTMDAGCVHEEAVGPAGVRYVAGRRAPEVTARRD